MEFDSSEPTPQSGPRLYRDADHPQCQYLKERLETEWVDLLPARTGLSPEQLPFLWDCNLMLGEADAKTPERYVLSEINVSSVAPFPESVVEPLITAVRRRLKQI